MVRLARVRLEGSGDQVFINWDQLTSIHLKLSEDEQSYSVAVKTSDGAEYSVLSVSAEKAFLVMRNLDKFVTMMVESHGFVEFAHGMAAASDLEQAA